MTSFVNITAEPEDAVMEKKIVSDHNIMEKEDSDDDKEEKDKGIKDNEGVNKKVELKN